MLLKQPFSLWNVSQLMWVTAVLSTLSLISPLQLTSLGLRHLCIVSGDPFTLGCLSASFNDGDDPVGTGLQVPLVGWRGIHLSLMSRIKTELKEWGKWWYLIYGQGAVLDHLYSSLAAGKPSHPLFWVPASLIPCCSFLR